MRVALAGLAAVAVLCLQLRAGSQTPLPWPPQYKLKPEETHRLTAADVVGPDGLVYPDWRYAGVPGGIPDASVVANIEDFGAVAGDGNDDRPAIVAAIDAAVAAGGGAVAFGEGVYHLDAPVVITRDNIVLRGAGMDQTKIVFRYMPHGVEFFSPRAGESLGPDHYIEVHAAPRGGISSFKLESEGRLLRDVPPDRLNYENFVLRAPAAVAVDMLGSGTHTLRATATWKSGGSASAEISVYVDPELRLPEGGERYPIHDKSSIGAFLFVGDKTSGKSWHLAEDAKRGDMEIVLDGPADLPAGAALLLFAPLTDRWNQLTGNKSAVQDMRRYHFRVESCSGARVRLNQPCRIDFPAVDNVIVQRLHPIRRCGVEGMTIEQTEKLWTEVVLFLNAWECWGRDVKIVKAGRYPVYTRYAKWCEIRDCVFEDAWYHGGGGTAYAGFERSYDCLMENVHVRRYRHAPCLQWAAAGNVIRQSTFEGSDAQWHAGWANENLFEQCVVDAHGDTGSYGYGAYSTPPHDRSHGPIGPRNVVYNCDFRSPKAGLRLSGSNEGWLILHNRFIADTGPAVLAVNRSFDHIFRNNVFVLKDPSRCGIELDGSCVGVEVIDNTLYGGAGRMVGGEGAALREEGSRLHPLDLDAPRPSPAVPSIFAWQRGRRP
ncbi:right-handed parallel beta-helix repeat-containing protein [bacterium]|nr:right-handed parallel beta-helix repeat-containing protein [bacterium]